MSTPSRYTIGVALVFISLNAYSQYSSYTRFACVGDFGNNQGSQAVANLVASWHPDMVVTTGDNNYTPYDTSMAAWDNEVGQFYGSFIRYPLPSRSRFAPGPTQNRFYPALGNHDWDAGIDGWYRYFSLPGNERYWEIVRGPVHFFFLDSDGREPDGNTSTSVQGQWLQQRLANSVSPFRVVIFHHPPYTSGPHGNAGHMQWPFAQWGASLVLNGHDHTYERIVKNGFNYIVNGFGGRPLYTFNTTPEPGSVVRYNSNWGAMLINATANIMIIKAYSIANQLIDSLAITAQPLPVQLASFSGRFVAPSRVRLNWMTLTETNNFGFEIQKRIGNQSDFLTVPNGFVPGNGTTITPHSYSFTDSNATQPNLSYRLRIIDLDGEVEYSEPISVSSPTPVTSEAKPSEFRLDQNFPNPFNPSTTIHYSLHKESRARLRVFDPLGREVATLVDDVKKQGEHEIRYSTTQLASGIYFYRLDAAGLSTTKQFVVLK